jgi:hypothetical protein
MRFAERIAFAGQADIAVVVANHVIAGLGEAFAEGVRPQDELAAEPHDQQDRRVFGASESFVFDAKAIGHRLRH